MELNLRNIEGDFSGISGNVAIVASRFNEFMVERLVEGAVDILRRHGVSTQCIDIVKVPGAYEIPLTCQKLAQTKRYQGIIALGVVIRGATPHFDYVAGACANGVLQAQLTAGIPISFGVLTTETMEQAIERAGSKAGNKGSEAAMVLLEMINLLGKINE